MEASRRIEEALLSLAWSLWTELGVAGVERHHRDCAVDPEALLVFTSTLAERDRRLREESLDCALAIAPYLFVSRLKTLLKATTQSVQARFEPLAATFNELTKTYVRMPQKESPSPWKVVPTGKSERGTFDRPSQVVLRCRSVFGVAARADVMATMASVPKSGWTASELAERTNLAKRVVASALQDLERGGILRSTAIGNRLRFDPVPRARLDAFVGMTPPSVPHWPSILSFAAGTLSLVEHAPDRNETALLVDAQKLVSDFLEPLARMGWVFGAPAFQSWPDVSEWLTDQIELLAEGRSLWLEEPAAAASRMARRRSSLARRALRQQGHE